METLIDRLGLTVWFNLFLISQGGEEISCPNFWEINCAFIVVLLGTGWTAMIYSCVYVFISFLFWLSLISFLVGFVELY